MALMGAFRGSLRRMMAAKNPAYPSAMDKIDWEEFDRCVKGWSWSPPIKEALLDFRHQLVDLIKRVESTFVTEEFHIDWDAHKKILPAHVVDFYKKTYEAMEFPKLDLPTEEYTQKFKDLEPLVDEDDKKIAALRAEVQAYTDKMNDLKARFATMTVDEYLAEFPEVKERIDAEIRDNDWGYEYGK